MNADCPGRHLVLHVEIPGFWADDLDECAAVLSEPDPPGPEDRLYVVTEEWMRETVGITLVSIPGEKCLSDDFEVKAFTGRIVGAEARPAAAAVRGRGAADEPNVPHEHPTDYDADTCPICFPDDARPAVWANPPGRGAADGDADVS